MTKEIDVVNAELHDERKGLYIKTFGCQMNEYDSAKLGKLLETTHRLVSDPQDASLILINTCSVREKPAEKLFSMLGQFRELKESNFKLLIGVGGCVAQQEGEKIIKRSRLVDFVFGTHNLSLVPSLVSLCEKGDCPQVAIDYRDEWESLPLGFVEQDRVSIFVTISRGCNKKCAYCIVPRTRGPEVSRNPNEILRELEISVRSGVKEVTLLGQNVNSYGHDLNPRSSFAELLAKVSQIEGLKRIRFTSPHPQEVKQDFIDIIGENPKICKHVHLPLQSGSNSILKSMRRNYRREKYLSIVSAIKNKVPDISFTTDIIVGFPGESEKDFLDTLSIIEEVQFDSSFSFMFSPRPGTVAAELEGQIEEAEKLRRLQMLQRKQLEISEVRLKNWIGQKGEILIDGPSASNKQILQGRLSQNLMVNLNAPYETIKPGMLLEVEIIEAGRHTLKAKPVMDK
ncbi:MAG: tRNA (N6-isopentenyl adenosine(37)-C2)-methylthiotransferase MiaB [SAR324 cluster bacterium]|uniref:tRNA-2-methylthio-N(6)-dimethylallyladenosine synthase n=1 Tax=SAR324 cluster bacterium TaxID=2024889 RepID=A0A7X9FSE1_9DELT|nr:tRNA (N6-isopentenyl adenosine(37)-C2)-methylthiotransferase MiaB [SAR324 cluster bacterium]